MRYARATAPARNTANAAPITVFRPVSLAPLARGAPTGSRVEVSAKAGIMWKNRVNQQPTASMY
jgi:hypothetical protein